MIIVFIELTNELLLIIMFGSAILLIMLYKTKQKSTRKNKTVGSELLLNENTTHLIQEQKESYESIISGQKQQIKSLQMAVNRYKGIYPDEDEDEDERQTSKVSLKNLEENYDIDIQKALPLLDTFKSSIPFLKNMDSSQIPTLLNNPLVKNYIWDYVKKNKEQMLQLGIIVPKGTVQQIQEKPKEQVQTNGINSDGTKTLQFEQSNAQFMA